MSDESLDRKTLLWLADELEYMVTCWDTVSLDDPLPKQDLRHAYRSKADLLQSVSGWLAELAGKQATSLPVAGWRRGLREAKTVSYFSCSCSAHAVELTDTLMQFKCPECGDMFVLEYGYPTLVSTWEAENEAD